MSDFYNSDGKPDADSTSDRNGAFIVRHRAGLLSIVACIGLVVFGVMGFNVLSLMKQRPAEAKPVERALNVEVVSVEPEDVPVIIAGLGSVRPVDVVSVAPEVAGTVVEIHPNLEVGEVIPQGEALFVIDPRTYEAAAATAEAQTAQMSNTVQLLRTQFSVDKERMTTLKRSRDLANAEYGRRKSLFEKDEVGTLSGVEAAEQAYNGAQDAVDQMDQALETYPIRIKEAESGLKAAEAQSDQAKLSLERTRVVAPFDARVKSQGIRVGQYVAPGLAVLVLANDSVLELSVPLDSREARRWLKFGTPEGTGDKAWFTQLEPVTCTIRWTDAKGGDCWNGTLHRVEKFDQASRTVTVAVRVEGKEAMSKDGALPLVEGMFCSVEIPGHMMKQVYRLPSWAVSFEDTVYTAVEQQARAEAGDGTEEENPGNPGMERRLRTAAVEVVHEQGEHKFVSSGLSPGDLVVTTRLVNPLEGSLLDIATTTTSTELKVASSGSAS